jgi:serine/threonine protein kinase
MYYKSPEMLMDYMQSELSTDIWSLGCVFAALLYRRSIFFVGENNMHQLITIADVRTLCTLCIAVIQQRTLSGMLRCDTVFFVARCTCPCAI